MATKLIEGVVADMLTYLQAGMAAKLTELDARFADGITLLDVKAWYTAQQRAIPEFPAVVIMARATRPLERGDGWLRGHHEVEIVVMADDQDSQTLVKRIQRYVMAVFELLVEAESSAGWTIIHEKFAADYDQVFTQADTFLSDARLVVTASRIETL